MPLIFKDTLIMGIRKYLSSNQIKKSNNINVKVVDLVQHSSLSTKPDHRRQNSAVAKAQETGEKFP